MYKEIDAKEMEQKGYGVLQIVRSRRDHDGCSLDASRVRLFAGVPEHDQVRYPTAVEGSRNIPEVLRGL